MSDNSVKPQNKQYYDHFQSDPVGAAILEEMSALFYDADRFSPDPYRTAFNLGQRDVIAYVLKRCRVRAPEAEE